MKTSTKLIILVSLGLGFFLGRKSATPQPCTRRVRMLDLVLEIDRDKSLEILTKNMAESEKNLYYEDLVLKTLLRTAATSKALVLVTQGTTALITGTTAFRYLPQYRDEAAPRDISRALRFMIANRAMIQFGKFTLTRVHMETEPGETSNFDLFRVTESA